MARHNSISKSDEELVKSVLADEAKRNALYTAAGKENETGHVYISAIDKFMDGNTYEFLFGIMTASKAETLPEGVICRRINAGEWVVYKLRA